MTNPDRFPIVDAVRVPRICSLCGRDHLVLTDRPELRGESICLLCVLSTTLLTTRPTVTLPIR